MSNLTKLSANLSKVFPKLSFKSQKGDSGKIAVIGGSRDFTGAPYYAAIAALNVGADLAQVFCSESAALAIKSYSPEIMVTPVFRTMEEIKEKYMTKDTQQKEGQSQQNMEKIIEKVFADWVKRIKSVAKVNAWIVGPGLGRDPLMTKFYPILLKEVLPKTDPIIFDADGIYHLTENPSLFQVLHKQFKKVILTPNLREFKHVAKHMPGIQFQKFEEVLSGKCLDLDKLDRQLQQLGNSGKLNLAQDIHQVSSQLVQNIKELPVNLVLKGAQDIILRKMNQPNYKISTISSPKRCGGVGDTLSGVLTVLCFWDWQKGPILASQIVRLAARKAYFQEFRSMTAPTVIKMLGKSVQEVQNYYRQLAKL